MSFIPASRLLFKQRHAAHSHKPTSLLVRAANCRANRGWPGEAEPICLLVRAAKYRAVKAWGRKTLRNLLAVQKRGKRGIKKPACLSKKGQVLACLVCRATSCGAGQQLALQAQSAGRELLLRARHLAPYVLGRTRYQRIAGRLLEFIWLGLSSEGAAYDTRSCQRFA